MANENETHEEVCTEMRSFGDVPPPMFAWRDLAERAEAAHNREIEIASKYSAEHEARIFDALRKRDALIKELADVIEKQLCDFECEKTGKCISYFEDTDPVKDCPALRERALVTKAREVVGSNRANDGAEQDGEVCHV